MPSASPAPDDPPPTAAGDSSPEDHQALGQALSVEMNVLMASLAATWSVSMARVTILLAVLSAVIVALSFIGQGTAFGPAFLVAAAILLPLLLFLGLATFVRVVQGTREAVVFITGMNRIRRFFAEVAPRSLDYLALPIFDDEAALARSPGGGMHRRPPRARLSWALVQVPGIVAVIDSAVAGALAALLATWAGLAQVAVMALAVAAFLATAAALLGYWRSSVRDLSAGLEPRFPTPPDQLDRPLGHPGRPPTR